LNNALPHLIGDRAKLREAKLHVDRFARSFVGSLYQIEGVRFSAKRSRVELSVQKLIAIKTAAVKIAQQIVDGSPNVRCVVLQIEAANRADPLFDAQTEKLVDLGGHRMKLIMVVDTALKGGICDRHNPERVQM